MPLRREDRVQNENNMQSKPAILTRNINHIHIIHTNYISITRH
jgi:hypothetical protein